VTEQLSFSHLVLIGALRFFTRPSVGVVTVT